MHFQVQPALLLKSSEARSQKTIFYSFPPEDAGLCVADATGVAVLGAVAAGCTGLVLAALVAGATVVAGAAVVVFLTVGVTLAAVVCFFVFAIAAGAGEVVFAFTAGAVVLAVAAVFEVLLMVAVVPVLAGALLLLCAEAMVVSAKTATVQRPKIFENFIDLDFLIVNDGTNLQH